MATNAKFSNAAVNAGVDAIAVLLNTGYLRIYDGTQPTDADTALGSQTQLAELRFGSTAFASGSAGVAAANSITQDSSADASGTATWYRALKSDGTSKIHDGTVGTSAANLILNSVSITAGLAVQVSSFSLTVSKG